MGRHGEITIDLIETPKGSAVRPEKYGKYITSYRVAAQESWRRKIGQRLRRVIRKYPRLQHQLRTVRSKLRRSPQ